MKLDLSDPWQGRRYLKLFVEDASTGFRYIPDLSLDEKAIGFSFSSNSLGLRGSDEISAGTVISGTSFAMGLCVNDGENWYELLHWKNGYLNLGFPTGFHQLLDLIETLHDGPRDELIFIYHPNLWSITARMEYWDKGKESIFDHYGWKTNLSSTLKIYFKKIMKTAARLKSGKAVYQKHLDSKVLLDSDYCRTRKLPISEVANNCRNKILSVFGQYKRVRIFRIPVKEQLIGEPYKNEYFVDLHEHYNEGWECFKGITQSSEHIDLVDKFDLSDFHEKDNHLNILGNRKMSELIRKNG